MKMSSINSNDKLCFPLSSSTYTLPVHVNTCDQPHNSYLSLLYEDISCEPFQFTQGLSTTMKSHCVTKHYACLDPLSNFSDLGEISGQSINNPPQYCEPSYQNALQVPFDNSREEDDYYSLSSSIVSMPNHHGSVGNTSATEGYKDTETLSNSSKVDETSVESTKGPLVLLCENSHQNAFEVPYNNPRDDDNYSLSAVVSRESNICGSIGSTSGGNRISNTKRNPRNHQLTMQINPELTSYKGRDGENNGDGSAGGRVAERHQAPRLKHYRSYSQKSSKFRGVCRYEGHYEAFLWYKPDPQIKGKTVYIGGFTYEEEAARAYDLAAIKVSGDSITTNFPLKDYENEIKEMKNMTRDEYLISLRRKSKGFSKGVSAYRGVSRLSRRNSSYKKWQARLGAGRGLKGIHLGLFDTEEAAAQAYDIAAIRLKGKGAITNFDLRDYDIESIYESKRLPIGEGASKTLTKNSVGDVIFRQRDVKKAPILSCQYGNSQANPQMQSLPTSNYQCPSSSCLQDYQNPKFQTNPTILHELPGTGSGLETNSKLRGSLNGRVPSREDLARNSTIKGTDKNSEDGFWEELLEFEHDQAPPVQENWMLQFYQDNSCVTQVLHQSTSSSFHRDHQNPNSQTKPHLLHNLAATKSGWGTDGNSSDSPNGGFQSNGVLQGNSTIMKSMAKISTRVSHSECCIKGLTVDENPVQPTYAETEDWIESLNLEEVEFSFGFNWGEG